MATGNPGSSAEDRRLLEEFEYLTNLINSHKQAAKYSVPHHSRHRTAPGFKNKTWIKKTTGRSHSDGGSDESSRQQGLVSIATQSQQYNLGNKHWKNPSLRNVKTAKKRDDEKGKTKKNGSREENSDHTPGQANVKQTAKQDVDKVVGFTHDRKTANTQVSSFHEKGNLKESTGDSKGRIVLVPSGPVEKQAHGYLHVEAQSESNTQSHKNASRDSKFKWVANRSKSSSTDKSEKQDNFQSIHKGANLTEAETVGSQGAFDDEIVETKIVRSKYKYVKGATNTDQSLLCVKQHNNSVRGSLEVKELPDSRVSEARLSISSTQGKPYNSSSKYKFIKKSPKAGPSYSHSQKNIAKISMGAKSHSLSQSPVRLVKQDFSVHQHTRKVILSKYKFIKKDTPSSAKRKMSHRQSPSWRKKKNSVENIATSPSKFSWTSPNSKSPSKATYTLINKKATKRHYKIVKNKLASVRSNRSISTPGKKKSATWVGRYSLKRDEDMNLRNPGNVLTLNQILGRKVKNLSRNKYKFVRGITPARVRSVSRLSTRFVKRQLEGTRWHKQSLKLDRRNAHKQLKNQHKLSEANNRLVVIGGIVYRSSHTNLSKHTQDHVQGKGKHVVIRKLNTSKMKTVTVRGVKFKMDPSGKTLQRVATPALKESPRTSAPAPAAISPKMSIKRVDIGGVTYVQKKPGTLVKASSVKSRLLASQVLHKSITTINKYKKTKKQYCMFFNRFGKCNRGNKCPYIHDKDKIAVCTRFLRGTCKVDDCPFSHTVAKEKMPVCSYFLKGVCSKDNCLYLHVNVNRNAEVCQDFITGYCALGEKCKKKHTLVCPSFSETGKCENNDKCLMIHRRRGRKRTHSGISKHSTPLGDGVVARIEPTAGPSHISDEDSDSSDDSDTPFKRRKRKPLTGKLPSFISLKTVSDESVVEEKEQKNIPTNLGASPILIKPRL